MNYQKGIHFFDFNSSLSQFESAGGQISKYSLFSKDSLGFDSPLLVWCGTKQHIDQDSSHAGSRDWQQCWP
jgi:hypothetical protein